MLKEVNTLKDFKQTVGLITIAFKKKKREHLSSFFFFLIAHLFIFGCAGSSLLHWLFSSCGEPGLLCSCGPWASHCGDSSVAEDGP